MNNTYYPTGQELRSTNRPIYGASSTLINNSIYIYGGFYNVHPWNKEAMWLMSATHSLTQLPTDPFASPAVIYTSLQATGNSTLLALGGHLNEQDLYSRGEPENLRYYAFNLNTFKWTPLQKRLRESSPLERFWHTTVVSRGSIYLYGGMNVTHGMSDFWKYDIQQDQWTLLGSDTKPRCGHTSIMTDDGKIVHLGGFDCSLATFTNPSTKILYSMDTATIYDTEKSIWYEQPLGGQMIPKPRTFHTAAKTQDDRIIVCGGQDHTAEPFQNYLAAENSRDMTAILDIRTWSWNIPESSPYQPFPRSHAIANIVNDTTMIYGFGINYHTVFDGIYVLDLKTNTWLASAETNVNTQETILHSNFTLVVFLSTISGIVILTLISCFGYKTIKRKKIDVSLSLKKSIWSPRAGEPLWAELYRLSFRFLFSIFFIGVGIILFLQVQNSPIMDQQYFHHESDYSIAPPDIRFCFDGWDNPFIQCVTDYGETCSQYIQNITNNVGSNINYYGSNLVCYLFRAHSHAIKLGKTSNRYRFNGTSLRFHYHGTPLTDNSRLHVELYHHVHNPNIPVYNISDVDGFDRWYSPDETARFQSMEQMNLKTENTFTVNPSTIVSIGYEILERKKMRSNNLWNYIGFSSDTENQYSITSHIEKQSPSMQQQGAVHVIPDSYSTSISSEQRVFTFMNCMGIIGGIFGLIAGFQASLFGYRPRSPWGVLHRWSNTVMQRSLLNGLKSKLPLQQVQVPIVHPLKARLSLKKDEEDTYSEQSNRMTSLEDRLYIFELLFQEYYIDDEVFRSLHNKTAS